MGKQIVVYLYNGMLFLYNKEWNTDTAMTWQNLKNIMLIERGQTQKATYCMTAFIRNVQKMRVQGREVGEWLPGAGEWCSSE